MIVGVTGRNCSGKDTVAEILIKKSFYHYSLSDALREELRKRGKEVTRENLIELGNSLRSTHGHGVLAEMALRAMKSDKNYVVTSIRNPGEVETLRKARKDFVLVTIDAPASVRFERLKSRAKKEDVSVKTLEDFKILEKQDESSDPSKLQVVKVMKMADVVITNEADLDTLHTNTDKFLAKWTPKLQLPRPSWDQYFMNIAREVSSRSNCIKRKVAAVIIKDKRIISTGYNGTPRNTRNCNEGGCARCNNYATGGTKLDECTCSHGEENAIVQAAYHGVSLKGSTLYTTFSPCLTCSKMIINAGIVEVIYNVDYPLADTAKSLLKEAGIRLRQFKID
jgi:dCMP deaminase